MTNFHLPRSTLFMLVCAFAGTETMKAAYAHANQGGTEKVTYEQLCAKLVTLDESTRCKPNAENAAKYAAQLEKQMELTGRLNQTGWL